MSIGNSYIPERIEEKSLDLFLNRNVSIRPKSGDPKEVKIRKIVREILSELEKEQLSEKVQVKLAGSYLSHLLISPRPYNDADCKIIVRDKGCEEPVAVALKIEAAIRRAISSCLGNSDLPIQRLIQKPMYMAPILFPSRAMARYSFDGGLMDDEKEFSFEISVSVLNSPDLPVYVLGNDSFTVPLTLCKKKLASPSIEGAEANPGAFWLHSYEGDAKEVKDKVIQGWIFSENEEESNGDGWFKILREMTLLGHRVFDPKFYQRFYTKNFTKVEEFNKKKTLRSGYLSFLLNAFFYSTSFKENLLQELEKRGREEGDQKQFVYLEKGLKLLDPESAKTVFKLALPLLAEEIERVDHLGEKHIKCKFVAEGVPSYVLVPELKVEENLDPLVDVFSDFKRVFENFKTPQEKTKKLIRSIEGICNACQSSGKKVPGFIWKEMESWIQIHRKEPWKRLFEKLIKDIDFPLDKDGQSFFYTLLEKAYEGEIDLFKEPPSEAFLKKFQNIQGKDLKDPFHFEMTLSGFLKSYEIESALNLLRYQSAIFPFSSVQTVSQELFSTGNQMFLDEYESYFWDKWEAEKDSNQKLQMAVHAYGHPFKRQERESLLEEEVVEALPSALSEALKGCKKKDFLQKLKEKIREGTEELSECRIKVLSEQSSESEAEFVLELLLAKKCVKGLVSYFPLLCKEVTRKVLDDEVRFTLISRYADLVLPSPLIKDCIDLLFCFSVSFGKKSEGRIKEIGRKLSSDLPPKDRVFITRKWSKELLNVLGKDLLQLILPSEDEKLEEGIELLEWSVDGIKTFSNILREKEKLSPRILDALFLKYPEKDLTSEAGEEFLVQNLPLFSEANREKCFRRNIHKAVEEMANTSRSSSMYRILAFLMREEFSSLFERVQDSSNQTEKKEAKFPGQVKKVEAFCFSNFQSKFEGFKDLLKQKTSKLLFLKELVSQLHRSKDEDEKHAALTFLLANPETHDLAKIALSKAGSLPKEWSEMEISKGFSLFSKAPEGRSTYVRAVYQHFLANNYQMPVEILSHLSQEEREMCFDHYVKKSKETNQKSWFMNLPTSVLYFSSFHLSYFYESSTLYRFFIEILDRFSIPEKPDQELLKKTISLVKHQAGEDLLELQQKVGFRYGSFLEEETSWSEEQFAQLTEGSLKDLKDTLLVKSVKEKAFFLRALISRFEHSSKEANCYDLLDTYLEETLLLLSKEIPSSDLLATEIANQAVLSLVDHFCKVWPKSAPPQKGKIEEIALKVIPFLTTPGFFPSAQEMKFKLFQQMFTPIFSKEEKGLPEEAYFSCRGFDLYLGFLDEATLLPNQPLKSYIKANRLFLEKKHMDRILDFHEAEKRANRKSYSLQKDWSLIGFLGNSFETNTSMEDLERSFFLTSLRSLKERDLQQDIDSLFKHLNQMKPNSYLRYLPYWGNFIQASEHLEISSKDSEIIVHSVPKFFDNCIQEMEQIDERSDFFIDIFHPVVMHSSQLLFSSCLQGSEVSQGLKAICKQMLIKFFAKVKTSRLGSDFKVFQNIFVALEVYFGRSIDAHGDLDDDLEYREFDLWDLEMSKAADFFSLLLEASQYHSEFLSWVEQEKAPLFFENMEDFWKDSHSKEVLYGLLNIEDSMEEYDSSVVQKAIEREIKKRIGT